MANINHPDVEKPLDAGDGDELGLTSELEECLAMLVRAIFVNSIDPSWSQEQRWSAYVNFPDLPWDPRPEDLPIEIPDP